MNKPRDRHVLPLREALRAYRPNLIVMVLLPVVLDAALTFLHGPERVLNLVLSVVFASMYAFGLWPVLRGRASWLYALIALGLLVAATVAWYGLQVAFFAWRQ